MINRVVTARYYYCDLATAARYQALYDLHDVVARWKRLQAALYSHVVVELVYLFL